MVSTTTHSSEGSCREIGCHNNNNNRGAPTQSVPCTCAVRTAISPQSHPPDTTNTRPKPLRASSFATALETLPKRSSSSTLLPRPRRFRAAICRAVTCTQTATEQQDMQSWYGTCSDSCYCKMHAVADQGTTLPAHPLNAGGCRIVRWAIRPRGPRGTPPSGNMPHLCLNGSRVPELATQLPVLGEGVLHLQQLALGATRHVSQAAGLLLLLRAATARQQKRLVCTNLQTAGLQAFMMHHGLPRFTDCRDSKHRKNARTYVGESMLWLCSALQDKRKTLPTEPNSPAAQKPAGQACCPLVC